MEYIIGLLLDYTFVLVGLFFLIGLIILIVSLGHVDDIVRVKSSRAVYSYDYVSYFKDDNNRIYRVENALNGKKKVYKVKIRYISPAGRSSRSKVIKITPDKINHIKENPTLIMSSQQLKDQKKAEKELAKKEKEALKEQARLMLEEKQHSYYEKVNSIIDSANNLKSIIVIKEDQSELDNLIAALFDRTVNSIKKIKDMNSDEWIMLDKLIANTADNVQEIDSRNKKITDYYNSSDFMQIKDTCKNLMDSQRDFNEYIEEKAESISTLFGSRIIRNETVNQDKYDYIRPYKKTISPFTAEVSSTVFASAENNPMDYIIKYFYPSKTSYPEQIQKLKLLIGELETLREAKQIIENYKKEYQQYLTDVPDYITKYDEDGFYARLGFAIINESVLTVEYKFTYTSNGGLAQRSFSVPMIEDTIIELIERLESKLSMDSFKTEQRALMTSKLRKHIKERDNYTCRYCENSTYKEPNLLLEIDHIIPIAKGGCTIEENLQTLCWKCNREKGSKIV